MIKYSVILPCYNEAHNIPRTLDSLRTATGGRSDIELIVVDDGSDDNSVQIAEQRGARVIRCHRLAISTIRNTGAAHARGSYLYFLDIDVAVPAGLFTALDSFIAEGRYDVLGFVDLAPAEAPWFARTWSLRSLARRENYMAVQWLPGRNIFLPKELFDRVGGFNEKLCTGEDKDFVFRLRKAGARVASDSRLILAHYGYERTFKEWCRKEFWRQHSHLRLLQSQGASLRLLRFPILALYHLCCGLYLVISLLRGIAPGPIFYCCWLLPAVAQTLGFRESRRAGIRFFQYLLLFFVRFHIAGAAIVQEFFEIIRRR